MEDIFLQLINLSLAVGMVILLAALVRPLLARRYRRALLRGIWAVLAVRLLLPVSLPAAAVEMELPASLGQPVAARVAAPLPGGESESIQSGGQELPAASQENAATVPASLPAASPLELAALVWLAGAAVLAVVSIGRHLAWKCRVLTLAQPVSHARQQIFLRACRACGVRPPRLLGSPAVDTPLAFGLLRPAVLLPEREWTDGELYAVLCHELCHIRRGDLWLQGIIRLACWAHWFNPAVWLLARLAGEDMELACDERVLRLADAPAGRDYGRALLETACRVRPAGHTSCFSAAGRSLSRRLGAIVVQVKKRPGRPLLALALAAALGCTGLAACTVAPEKEQPGSQPSAPSQPQPTPADETGYDSFSLYPTGGGVLDVLDSGGAEALSSLQLPDEWVELAGESQVRGAFCPQSGEALLVSAGSQPWVLYGQTQGDAMTWTRQELALPALEGDAQRQIVGIAIFEEEWVLSLLQTTSDYADEQLQVYHFSREDGLSFQSPKSFATACTYWEQPQSLAFLDPDTAVAAVTRRATCGNSTQLELLGYAPQPGVWITRNGGESWQPLEWGEVLADGPAEGYTAVSVRTEGDSLAVLCQTSDLMQPRPILALVSLDQGESWQWYPRSVGMSVPDLVDRLPQMQSAAEKKQLYQQIVEAEGAWPD